MGPTTRGVAGTALLTVALTAVSGRAAAHVDYVVDAPSTAPEVARFLVETVTDPLHAALLGGGGLTVAVLAVLYLWVRPLRRDLEALRTALDGYADLVPWLLRISVGFPLVGAGFAGYFFSPAVEVQLRVLQVGVGFLVLFGLATRLAAATGALTYLAGLVAYPDLLLAWELFAGLFAIVLVGPGRPSADAVLDEVARTDGTLYGRIDPVHELAEWGNRVLAPYQRYLPVVLRVGLGASFLYLGITQKLLDPGRALAVVAKYDLTSVVPVAPELWVVGAGLAEAAVGVALLAGAFTRAAAGTAFLLFTLTMFGLPDDPVLAHLSLFGLVSALLITGAGPLSVDARLGETADDTPTAPTDPA